MWVGRIVRPWAAHSRVATRRSVADNAADLQAIFRSFLAATSESWRVARSVNSVSNLTARITMEQFLRIPCALRSVRAACRARAAADPAHAQQSAFTHCSIACVPLSALTPPPAARAAPPRQPLAWSVACSCCVAAPTSPAAPASAATFLPPQWLRRGALLVSSHLPLPAPMARRRAAADTRTMWSARYQHPAPAPVRPCVCERRHLQLCLTSARKVRATAAAWAPTPATP